MQHVAASISFSPTPFLFSFIFVCLFVTTIIIKNKKIKKEQQVSNNIRLLLSQWQQSITAASHSSFSL
jgi:hypothetical protein